MTPPLKKCKQIDKSLQTAKKILERNQYPPNFYDPIIQQTLREILGEKAVEPQSANSGVTTNPAETPKRPIFLQYRGKATEEFAKSLHNCKAPCTVIMTMRKLKSVLPSLKAQVEKHMKSGVVYKLQCARCEAAYVGQTRRHLATRIKEHSKMPSPVADHMQVCGSSFSMECATILETARREDQLKTLEALCIHELKPALNTQEDYRNRTLTIKLFC